MQLPSKVKIVEVSPRDGFQNEVEFIPTEIKVKYINLLSASGLKTIEATSFVSPKWIPQLKDHREVFEQINKNPNTSYPVMIFNQQGLENALQAGVKEIAVFTTPSEEFCRRNANCSVAESLTRIENIIQLARVNHLQIRGYISCVLGCPFEGKISSTKVLELVLKLLSYGCYEISLGDTIGIGTAGSTEILLNKILNEVNPNFLAVHFHDTYGQALANILIALQHGISTIDSSIAGLGGCPYAKGATGNVATEDVVYLLNGVSIETGINQDKLSRASHFILKYLNRASRSKVALAMADK